MHALGALFGRPRARVGGVRKLEVGLGSAPKIPLVPRPLGTPWAYANTDGRVARKLEPDILAVAISPPEQPVPVLSSHAQESVRFAGPVF